MKEEREAAIKEYDKFAKEYELPPREEFEEELEVFIFEPVLSGVARALLDRLFMCTGVIDQIMHPNHPADMMKSKFYDEKQKEKYWETYQQLQIVIAELMEAAFENRKERCKVLTKSYEEYKKVRPIIKEIFTIQKRGWAKPPEEETGKGYLG
jgi:hypothetical protein